jgi:hypothetical protein
MNHARLVGAGVLCAALAGCKGCGKNEDNQPPIGVPAPPRVATQQDIGTEIGNGRILDTGATDVSTSMKWSRIVPLTKEQAVIAGDVEGEACALATKDGGRSFFAYCTKIDMPLVTWSVGSDGTAVLSTARRQIPKNPPKEGTLPPVDTLTFYFAAPGQKLSAAAPLLAPDAKNQTPVVPRGTGMAAVLGPSLASVVVELRPKTYAVAFSAGAGEALPAPIELPKGEDPIAAPYGRAPQLLSVKGNKLVVRPWPRPGETVGEGKPIDRVGITKALVGELSAGPECESGGWSFKRVAQPPNKTFMLGVSPEATVFFELPATIVNTTGIACSAERVIVEAVNPADKQPSLVPCNLEGVCTPPQNRPFLKPWPEEHERKAAFVTTQKGVIAVQHLKTKVKWALVASESVDGGKLFSIERRFGGGDGNPENGYDMGALIGLGDRTLLLMSAKMTRTTRRSWYVLASDDHGVTWTPP